MRILPCFQPPPRARHGWRVFRRLRAGLRRAAQHRLLPRARRCTGDARCGVPGVRGADQGLPRSQLRTRLADTVERCGLGDVQHRILGKLSRATAACRLGAGRASQPPILILDEPTSGLDPQQVVEVRKLIRALAGEHTHLLSTHNLAEVSMICGRVIIINQGTSFCRGALGELDGG